MVTRRRGLHQRQRHRWLADVLAVGEGLLGAARRAPRAERSSRPRSADTQVHEAPRPRSEVDARASATRSRRGRVLLLADGRQDRPRRSGDRAHEPLVAEREQDPRSCRRRAPARSVHAPAGARRPRAVATRRLMLAALHVGLGNQHVRGWGSGSCSSVSIGAWRRRLPGDQADAAREHRELVARAAGGTCASAARACASAARALPGVRRGRNARSPARAAGSRRARRKSPAARRRGTRARRRRGRGQSALSLPARHRHVLSQRLSGP